MLVTVIRPRGDTRHVEGAPMFEHDDHPAKLVHPRTNLNWEVT
jgi:hypothetical protein